MRQLITTPGQVGEIFRGRRKALGVSQQELATKVGVTQGRLSTLESDPASLPLERLLLLAKLLGLELILRDQADEPRPKAPW
jgi:HTH-type transcriptional regulator/antitoxin HipB